MVDTPKLLIRELEVGDTTAQVNSPTLHPIDTFTHLTLKSTKLSTPPVDPQPGDSYWLPTAFGSATGDWEGLENSIVTYYHGWDQFRPLPGMLAYIEDASVLARYHGDRSWISVQTVSKRSLILTDGSGFDFDTAPPKYRPIMFTPAGTTLLQIRGRFTGVLASTVQFRMFSGSQIPLGGVGSATGSLQNILLGTSIVRTANAFDFLLAIENQPTDDEWIWFVIEAASGTPQLLELYLHYSELL